MDEGTQGEAPADAEAQNDAAEYRRWLESQVKWLESAYEKSKAYTNLVIVAGYAGFFALWQATRGTVGGRHSAWAALLMLFSLTSFVLYEVFKMFWTERNLLLVLEMLHAREQAGESVALSVKEKAFRDAAIRSMVWGVRTWRIQLWLAVPPALVAAFVLGSGFVCACLAEACVPVQ